MKKRDNIILALAVFASTCIIMFSDTLALPTIILLNNTGFFGVIYFGLAFIGVGTLLTIIPIGAYHLIKKLKGNKK